MVFRVLIAGCLVAGACTRVPPELTVTELAALEAPPREIVAQVDAQVGGFLSVIDAAEARALSTGRGLTEAEIVAARKLGVAHPEEVRVLVTGDFPGTGGIQGALKNRRTGGLTTGYGIHVRPKFAGEAWLILHELVHVAQFERLGREGMARRYLTESLILPGNLIPLEREAIEASEALLGTSAPEYAF